MKEGGGGAGGGAESGSGGGGRGGATSHEVGGGRLRFTVELRPGETTIVSWKKLLKDATNSNSSAAAAGTAGTGSAQFPDLNAPPAPTRLNSSSSHNPQTPHPHHPSLDSRISPGQVPVGEKGGNDAEQPPSNRLNTVIERIERLYVGRASSDDEDANDVVPDDDEYDTEDSFIDDTELDEYFQVDNSAVKHDGFFVNRGKLERVEPSAVPNEQPKKRRRKDGGGDGHNPNKHVKVAKKAGKPVSMVEKNASAVSTVALPNIHGEDANHHNQAYHSDISSRKKYADFKAREQCLLGVLNGNEMAPGKDFGLQKPGADLVNNHGPISDASHQRPQERSLYLQSINQSGKSLNNSIVDQCGQQKEKNGVRERSEPSVADGKNSLEHVVRGQKWKHIDEKASVSFALQTYTLANLRNHPVHKREGSSVRPKSTLLEKAIRDLEKLVAESRPPAVELQEGDHSSQAIKRRLPAEVKQKLAKVARFAQASHGKIPKELINRLMSIVGHLIQLRTLKRNLKIMVNMGLSAKQEKDSRVQLVKKEVAEMVMARIPLTQSEALEQQASDDFQEISAEEKEALKRKYSMDDSLEDKICDLYDLYVEGLEEDAGPQVRKLYAELSAMWPIGFMDNHGIKRAICRAKDRKRALNSHQKDSEKIKRKKMLTQKSETGPDAANLLGQPVHTHQKLVSYSGDHGAISVNKSTNKSVTVASIRMPVSFPNGSNMDHPKQERIKGSASSFPDIRSSETLQTKKKKRKSETESEGAHVRREKIISVQGDGKVKTHKVQVADPLQKSNPQPITSSNFDQHIV